VKWDCRELQSHLLTCSVRSLRAERMRVAACAAFDFKEKEMNDDDCLFYFTFYTSRPLLSHASLH
jgi:hypothetical protein